MHIKFNLLRLVKVQAAYFTVGPLYGRWMPQWVATGQEMALRKHLIAGKFRVGLGDTQLTLSRLGLRACFDVNSPATHCMKFTGDRIPLDLPATPPTGQALRQG